MFSVSKPVDGQALIDVIETGKLADVKKGQGDRPCDLDDTFMDKVLMPSFIDNHLHPLLVGGLLLQCKFITAEFSYAIMATHSLGKTAEILEVIRRKRLFRLDLDCIQLSTTIYQTIDLQTP
jgi:hypothetical protein